MYTPKPLDKYRHFKGKCYQVLCIAENSETSGKEVIYQALYAPYKIYARDLDMFMSKVDKEKYPDASQEYRFELLDDEGFVVERKDVDAVAEAVAEVEAKIEAGIEAGIETKTEDDSLKAENVAPVEKTPAAPVEKPAINPILEKFLDADTVDQKLEILNDEKENLTPEILTPIELSIGMEPQEGEAVQRYREIKNYLYIKQKYERQHR